MIEDIQKERSRYTGRHHKLTVEHVLEMIDQAEKKCEACHTDLLFQGYTKCHGQVFSIDRKDDSHGHYKWNVRFTCLSCNRRHKRVDPFDDMPPDDIFDFVEPDDDMAPSYDGCQFLGDYPAPDGEYQFLGPDDMTPLIQMTDVSSGEA